jgi:hypothetical protein
MDSSFAAIEFLAALRRYKVTCITRLRPHRSARLEPRAGRAKPVRVCQTCPRC